jgi:hypothetical protein
MPCGLLEFKLYLVLQDAGLILTQARNSILYRAHLYRRQREHLHRHWPDMNLVVAIRKREPLFARQVPRKQEDALKTTTLMQGVSATNFSGAGSVRAIYGGVAQYSKKGPKVGLTAKSPMLDVLRGKYLKDQSLLLTSGNIGKVSPVIGSLLHLRQAFPKEWKIAAGQVKDGLNKGD